MSKRKYNGDGVYSVNKTLRMVNAGGQRSTSLRLGTMRRYAPRSRSIVSLVKRSISRTEEKKESQLYSLNTPLPPSNNAGWTASSIQISPGTTGFSIPQGAGQGQRIGNQIRTKKAWVRGVLHILSYDVATNINPLPTEVRMFIFKDKFNRTGQPSAVALDLFQTGSTSIGPQNDLVDTILEFNKDRYQIYHEQVLKVGTAAYEGTGAIAAFQNFTNNDFSLNAKFEVDITKFLPTVVQYNDAGTQPMSDSLWMLFIPVQAGGGQFGASQISTSMSWTASYHYTDA